MSFPDADSGFHSVSSRSDSILSDQAASMRARPAATAPIRPSHVSNMDLQFIQNTLPTWLTEIEAKCARKQQSSRHDSLDRRCFIAALELREEIRRVQNDLKQLYDEPSLKQVNVRIFTPTAMWNIATFRFDILCTPFVFMKAVLHWDIFGHTSIMPISTSGFATMTTKVGRTNWDALPTLLRSNITSSGGK